MLTTFTKGLLRLLKLALVLCRRTMEGLFPPPPPPPPFVPVTMRLLVLGLTLTNPAHSSSRMFSVAVSSS